MIRYITKFNKPKMPYFSQRRHPGGGRMYCHHTTHLAKTKLVLPFLQLRCQAKATTIASRTLMPPRVHRWDCISGATLLLMRWRYFSHFWHMCKNVLVNCRIKFLLALYASADMPVFRLHIFY